MLPHLLHILIIPQRVSKNYYFFNFCSLGLMLIIEPNNAAITNIIIFIVLYLSIENLKIKFNNKLTQITTKLEIKASSKWCFLLIKPLIKPKNINNTTDKVKPI